MLHSYSIKNILSHFEYKELTKIDGEMKLETISLLQRQVKRNAQGVPTTLGGGQLGFLALVISTEKYNAIPNSTPFLRPKDPGPFELHLPTSTDNAAPTPTAPTRRTTTRSITRATTPTQTDLVTSPTQQPTVIFSAEVATQKAAHDDAVKKKYYKCQAVEQALRSQIIEAIEAEYIDALRNIDTDMINASIPEIFDFLQINYGQITEEELVTREEELRNFDYDPQSPVDKVFTKITLFQDLCTITRNDKTDKQLCQIAYLIFNRTRAFVEALKAWNSKKTEDKTFALFKQHMRAEHHALKQVGALTIQDSTLYQSNMIQQVLDQQSTMQTNLQSTIDDQVKASLYNAITDFTTTTDNNQVINNISSTTEPNNSDALLKMIDNLNKKIDALTKPSVSTDINPRTGKKFKRYCWSCGCCTHWGRDCTQKKSGHKDTANFKNRMGGSNKNCLPACE